MLLLLQVFYLEEVFHRKFSKFAFHVIFIFVNMRLLLIQVLFLLLALASKLICLQPLKDFPLPTLLNIFSDTYDLPTLLNIFSDTYDQYILHAHYIYIMHRYKHRLFLVLSSSISNRQIPIDHLGIHRLTCIYVLTYKRPNLQSS